MSADIGAAELGRSFDCKFPNCANEARADRGQYAYCDEHRAQKAWLRVPRQSGTAKAKASANGGLTAELAELAKLQTLARNADKMRAKAASLTRQALAAKAAAEQAEQGYRDALRGAVGDSA